MLFPFINAVTDESLRQRVSTGQVVQIGVAGKPSSTTALTNGNNTSRNFIKNNCAHINIFSNNLTNFTVSLIFKYNNE